MESEMEVVSFRVPKRLKKEMKEIDENWSEDVRNMIESIVKKERKRKTIEKLNKMIEKLPSTLAGTADKAIREGRDSS